jgi:hypothetical protein
LNIPPEEVEGKKVEEVEKAEEMDEEKKEDDETSNVMKYDRIRLILETFVEMGEILMYPKIPKLEKCHHNTTNFFHTRCLMTSTT